MAQVRHRGAVRNGLPCNRDKGATEPSPSRLRRATVSVVASLYLIKLSPGQFDSRRERQDLMPCLRSCTKLLALPLGELAFAKRMTERASFCNGPFLFLIRYYAPIFGGYRINAHTICACRMNNGIFVVWILGEFRIAVIMRNSRGRYVKNV